MKKGTITYLQKSDRWTFCGDNGTFDLHCGEVFTLRAFGHYHPCRLELADDWYVIFDDVSFVLKHTAVYEVMYDI